MVASSPSPVIPGSLFGLTLSNDATTPTTVLDIAPGGTTSDDNTTAMVLSVSGFKKNCNAAWAVGSGNGALDTGSAFTAGSWYHVFLIERVDTYVVDVLISTSLTPTMPSGYTKKRRIWTISIDATPKIVPFVQLGDECLWVTPIGNYNNVSWGSGTVVAHTTSVPPGVKVTGIYQAYLAPTTGAAWFTLYSPDASGNIGNNPNGNITLWVNAGNGGAVELRMRTNTSQQIMFAGPNAGTGYSLITRGWLDNRGK
jgi:hypothetical protein